MAENENKLYPSSRLAEELALADYASSLPLPVEPLPTHYPYDLTGGQKVASSLSGANGQERFQSWPERMIRSGGSLPKEVYQGKVDPLSEKGIERTLDTASMAVTGPLAMKPGTASMGSGMTRMGKVIEGEVAPAFYSAVENAVKGAKQGKATAEEWTNFLKNQQGIKPEELAWTIKDLPAGQITKKQLEDHIAANKIELKEVVKSDFKPEELKFGEYSKDLDKHAQARFGQPYDHLLDSQQQQIRLEAFSDQGINPTKYSKYQLPGGENYKELLLTLPEKPNAATYKVVDEKGKILNITTDKAEAEGYLKLIPNSKLETVAKYDTEAYKSSHWDEPNVLAHIRMNDRIVNGKKTLHIEEIQSDWHQAGRKEGYKGEQNTVAKGEYDNLVKQRDELINKYNEHGNLIAARTKMSKEDRALEHEISQKLVEADTKANAGVPDAPFKKTWDELALKKVIRHAAENGYDQISWTPGEAQATRYDLSKQVDRLHYNTNTGNLTAFKDGNSVIQQTVSKEKLPDVIGKEAADKLLNKPTKTAANINMLEGADLKVGGEGMKAFYDKMLVDKANVLGKKFGSKVEQAGIDPSNGNPNISEATRQKDIAKNPIHVMKITPEMKQQVLGKGFPLFSAGLPTLTPVDNNPFESSATKNYDREMRAKQYRLVPVSHNPFET